MRPRAPRAYRAASPTRRAARTSEISQYSKSNSRLPQTECSGAALMSTEPAGPSAARPSTIGARVPGASASSSAESTLAGRSCPSPIAAEKISARGARSDSFALTVARFSGRGI